jgi:predicted nucleic acid-binding protein
VPFVLDASIAAAWHFPDARSGEADLALDRLAADKAIVPMHWWFEVRNVILTGERRQRASQDQSAAFMARIDRLPIEVAARPDAAAVLLLARKHGLTFYDACYLELAQRERIPVATLDASLARAALAESVALLA